MHIKTCRVCEQNSLKQILALGDMPPVNYFPTEKELGHPPKQYPLNLCLCKNCGLVQLDEVAPCEKLFENYHYLTSASRPLIDHFRALAEESVARRFAHPGDKVLDIGANDGTLLFEFQKKGFKTLGVDPSLNAVEAAHRIGIEVIPSFFSEKAAEAIHHKHGQFNIITATNVLAHTDDVRGFLRGVNRLLAPKGVFIVEFAHLLDMVVKNQFDVIYHEHLSYFSFSPLEKLFEMFDLKIFDGKKILTQGGSLRIYAMHKDHVRHGASPSLDSIIQEEKENSITDLTTLQRFAMQVQQFREDFRELIFDIKKKKRKIVGVGAPAKGVILLNYCDVGASEIDYIVDSTPLKQGRFFPGSHIPVYAEQKLESDHQDYFLLLSWNFQETILEKLKPYREHGAKVIIPFPKLRVI